MDADAIHQNRWRILAVLCLSLILVVVSVSSLNVALPTMQRALQASASDLQWFIDSYALVFAGLLLPAGALGDRFGRRGALQFGLAIFAGAAVLSSLSGSPEEVIAFRGVMGVGAALIMPATLSIITTVFPPEERTKAIAIWTGLAGAGGAIGPVTSGLLLEGFDWPAVFLINVPIALGAMALVFWIVPTSRDPESQPFDPAGALLSIGGLLVLLYAVIEGPNVGWTDPVTLGLFAAAAVLLALFAWWELRYRFPMLDPRLFRAPGFSVGSLTITLAFFALLGMFFLLTQYFQFVQGHSALGAGIRTLPMAGVMILVAPRSAVLVARYGPRPVMGLGLALIVAGLLLFLAFDPGTAYGLIALAIVLLAAGMGLMMPPATSAIVAGVPAGKAGVGSAVNDLTREVGGAIGIAVMGSVLSSAYRSSIDSSLTALPAGAADAAEESIGGALGVAERLDPSTAGALVLAAQEAFTDGLAISMAVGAAVVAVCIVAVLRFMPPRIMEPADEEAGASAQPLPEQT